MCDKGINLLDALIRSSSGDYKTFYVATVNLVSVACSTYVAKIETDNKIYSRRNNNNGRCRKYR